MKVRIGYGLGTRTSSDPARLGDLTDAMEELGYDSLWLSERLTGDAPDPLLALTFVAARTRRMKLGTSVLVIPGRNPVVLAKELATLDRLSEGRLLPVVGLGAPVPAEHRAFGVDRRERGALFDEALGLMRQLWSGDEVDHVGERFEVRGVRLRPRPVQERFDVWLGGRAPSELRRTGRLGDGWLPSFSTPEEVRAGWELVTETAAAHGRTIDPEHLGTLVAYSRDPLPTDVSRLFGRRRDDVDPAAVIPVGLDGLRRHLEALIAVGASKFVLVPLVEPADWMTELDAVRDAVFDLQT